MSTSDNTGYWYGTPSYTDVYQNLLEKIKQQHGNGQIIRKDSIETATDDVLILELVKRGYAVGRLNDKNQLEVE